jgi:hypothetical protein
MLPLTKPAPASHAATHRYGPRAPPHTAVNLAYRRIGAAVESAATASKPSCVRLARALLATDHAHAQPPDLTCCWQHASTSPGPLLDLIAVRPRAHGVPIIQCKGKQGDLESLVAVRLQASCCVSFSLVLIDRSNKATKSKRTLTDTIPCLHCCI